MVEKICKNCLLYDSQEKVCKVSVLINGETYELPVDPYDSCHWLNLEEESSKFKPDESLIEIQQIRIWSDGKNGYIESPNTDPR